MAGNARMSIFVSALLMVVGAAGLPWLGFAFTPGPGIAYVWQIPPIAIVTVAAAFWGLAAGAIGSAPNRHAALAALIGFAAVLGTAIVAEVIAMASIGRSALEVAEGEPLRLLPGPGQILFGFGSLCLLIGASGRSPVATIIGWIRSARIGPARAWLAVAGIGLIVLARSDTWLQASAFTLTGAEIPVLGQFLGFLVFGASGCAVWMMAKGGVLPRLVGGAFGIALALTALLTVLATTKLVDVLPVESLERSATEAIAFDTADRAVEEVASSIRDAGAGSGPWLAAIGVALLAGSAMFRDRKPNPSIQKGRPAAPPPPGPAFTDWGEPLTGTGFEAGESSKSGATYDWGS